MKRRTLLAVSPTGVRRSSRRLLPLVALGAAVALSACQTQSPIQTDVPYDPADGVPVHLGPVQLRDLVVVSTGKDKAGVLSASMSNTSGDALKVDFQLQQGGSASATAPAHSEVRLSGDQQVQLPSVPASPGDVVTLSVKSGTAPEALVVVPVVKAAGYYAHLAATQAPTQPAAP